MHIFLGTDHAGLKHKEAVKQALQTEYDVVDCGAYHLDEADDYPDYIAPAIEKLATVPNARAIIFGGSGQGEAMLANRYPHARAAVYYGGQPDILTLSREHNDANVLSIGARFVSVDETVHAVSVWLTSTFSNDERHVRRLQKVNRLHPSQ